MTNRVLVVCLFVSLSLAALAQEAPPPKLEPVPEAVVLSAEDLPVLLPESDAPQAQQPAVAQAVDAVRRPGGGVQTDTPVTDDILVGSNGSLYLGTPDVALKVFGTGAIQLFTNASSGGTGGVERMRIWSDGNVVVGSSSAQLRKFSVVGSGSVGTIFGHHDTTYTTSVNETPISVYGLTYSRIPNSGVTQSGSAYGVRGASYLVDTGTLGSAVGLSGEAGVYTGYTGTLTYAYGLYTSTKKNNGNITNGYGASIAYVDATVNGYGLAISDIYAPNAWGVYQAGANDYNYFAGKIGIGIAQPADLLHLSAASNGAIRMTHTDSTSAINAITFYEGSIMYGFINQRGSTNAQARQFNLGNSHEFGSTALYAGGSTRVFLQAGGNVGIGTEAPTAKLHVDGDIFVTGNIAAKYQDVAEWVPATEDLAPGTVVTLNPDGVNEVMASAVAYDTRVAGVVSEQPGIILGEGAADKERIATTGRVRIRVDASNAPIAVGDLLVTSDKPGYAMRSMPIDVGGAMFHRPGTILGKALEPLARGEGEILVLLSLQ